MLLGRVGRVGVDHADDGRGPQQLADQPRLAALPGLREQLVHLVGVPGEVVALACLRDRQQLSGPADQPRVGALVQRGSVRAVPVVFPLAAVHVWLSTFVLPESVCPPE